MSNNDVYLINLYKRDPYLFNKLNPKLFTEIEDIVKAAKILQDIQKTEKERIDREKMPPPSPRTPRHTLSKGKKTKKRKKGKKTKSKAGTKLGLVSSQANKAYDRENIFDLPPIVPEYETIDYPVDPIKEQDQKRKLKALMLNDIYKNNLENKVLEQGYLTRRGNLSFAPSIITNTDKYYPNPYTDLYAQQILRNMPIKPRITIKEKINYKRPTRKRSTFTFDNKKPTKKISFCFK
tara:strand:- start:80 stop:787 length:708 start_codon:yes stop_codon:yes gene_type:complete